MDDSRRSTSSAKPSAAAKLTSPDFQRADRCARGMVSEEIKENDHHLHGGAGLGSRNVKKEHKSFMSTTTYAAPRKKILAERNDAPPSECSGTYSGGDPEVRKPGQIHAHPDPAPQVASFPSRIHIHRSGEEAVVSSETQPYDPLTNYLSPRPKFLRYNPNKRREIYLRREWELKGTEGSSAFDPSGSFEAGSPRSERTPSDPPALPSVKQEGLDVKSSSSLQDKETGENVEEAEDDKTVDEEVEEEEEGPSWYNLVWKSVLLFGILFFSTFYISSVHPSPAVSPLQSFLSKGSLFKFQDSYREVAEEIGTNVNNFVATYTNTCIQGHFNELANWGNGTSSDILDGLLKYGDFGYEKLQDEGNVRAMWAGNVISNTGLVVVEGKRDESEESQRESQKTITEGRDVLIEEYENSSKETQYDDARVKAGHSYKMKEEKEESSNIVEEGLHLEHENGVTGAVSNVQHGEDVIMGTEIEETDDVTEQLSSKPASPQEESISDHGGEETGTQWSFEQGKNLGSKLDMDSPISFPETVEDAVTFRFHSMKLFATVIMGLTVAASTVVGFLHFRRTSNASAEDSSASFPNSGMVADGRDTSKVEKREKMGDDESNVPANADKHTEVYKDHPTTVKLVGDREDKGLNFSVDTDNYKEVYESDPSAVKLVEERFVDHPFLNTAWYKEAYERNPPAVKLLGEFSISGQGVSETKGPSLSKKAIRIEQQQHPLPEEVSITKGLPFVEEANQISPELLTPESAARRTPAQDEPLRKQRSGRRQEAERRVASTTPVRRSSRIRNRVTTSPGA